VRIRITVDGQPVVTIGQAAELLGTTPGSLRGKLTRRRQRGDTIQPAAFLDGKSPLYRPEDLGIDMEEQQ
jgi:hypothetical protein